MSLVPAQRLKTTMLSSITAMKTEWTLAVIASLLAAWGQWGIASHELVNVGKLLAIPGFNLAWKLGLEGRNGSSDLASYAEITTNFLFYFALFYAYLTIERRVTNTKRRF